VAKKLVKTSSQGASAKRNAGRSSKKRRTARTKIARHDAVGENKTGDSHNTVGGDAPDTRRSSAPKSLACAQDGIGSTVQFAALMSAVIADVLAGTITAAVANSACKASANILRMIDLQMKSSCSTRKSDILSIGN
jgi:hypothetical protein